METASWHGRKEGTVVGGYNTEQETGHLLS
jgi:hypothetical protein